jgi:hypothetical protein
MLRANAAAISIMAGGLNFSMRTMSLAGEPAPYERPLCADSVEKVVIEVVVLI